MFAFNDSSMSSSVFPAQGDRSKFQLLASVAVLYLTLWFGCVKAAGDEPWLIVIDGEQSEPNRKYSLEAVNKYVLGDALDDDSKRIGAKLREGLEKPLRSEFSTGTAESPLTGMMYVSDAHGLWQDFRFWRTSDQDHHNLLTASLMAKRGGKAELLESQNERVLKCDGEPERIGKLNIRWADAYIGFRDGIITLGGSSASRVTVADVARVCDENQSIANFIRFNPTAVADGYKSVLLS